ncbi:hypothetical protein ABPG75_006682 [Micractinium tetrahymenae]
MMHGFAQEEQQGQRQPSLQPSLQLSQLPPSQLHQLLRDQQPPTACSSAACPEPQQLVSPFAAAAALPWSPASSASEEAPPPVPPAPTATAAAQQAWQDELPRRAAWSAQQETSPLSLSTAGMLPLQEGEPQQAQQAGRPVQQARPAAALQQLAQQELQRQRAVLSQQRARQQRWAAEAERLLRAHAAEAQQRALAAAAEQEGRAVRDRATALVLRERAWAQQRAAEQEAWGALQRRRRQEFEALQAAAEEAWRAQREQNQAAWERQQLEEWEELLTRHKPKRQKGEPGAAGPATAPPARLGRLSAPPCLGQAWDEPQQVSTGVPAQPRSGQPSLDLPMRVSSAGAVQAARTAAASTAPARARPSLGGGFAGEPCYAALDSEHSWQTAVAAVQAVPAAVAAALQRQPSPLW